MKTDPLKQGALTENSVGIGTVTQEMVQERATELAVINGRSVEDVSVFDLEQAKRELTGETDIDPKDAILEAAPESERWDPVPGSPGQQMAETPDEESDDEGQNDSAQLVAEGVGEAEHDQMIEAARAGKRQAGRES